MDTVVHEETFTSRFFVVSLRVLINLIVIAVFVVIIAKTLHDLPQ